MDFTDRAALVEILAATCELAQGNRWCRCWGCGGRQFRVFDALQRCRACSIELVADFIRPSSPLRPTYCPVCSINRWWVSGVGIGCDRCGFERVRPARSWHLVADVFERAKAQAEGRLDDAGRPTFLCLRADQPVDAIQQKEAARQDERKLDDGKDPWSDYRHEKPVDLARKRKRWGLTK